MYDIIFIVVIKANEPRKRIDDTDRKKKNPTLVAERKYEDRDKMAALLFFRRLVCFKANKLFLRICGLQYSPCDLKISPPFF